ncbi:MAG: DUF5694 domain-containing protein [Pacificimonas sp.]|nr:DUF5694 domain-containing protein [Pacificimonas sp.]
MNRLLTAAALAVLPAQAGAAEDAAPADTQVMILGTYHFANPGRDVANIDVDDVLQPHRQREIAAIVDAIATWKPDRILVEAQRPAPDFHMESYAEYRAGDLRDNRNETVQIGYRLADRLGHANVYGFNEQASEGEPDYFPMGMVIETAEATGQSDVVQSFMTDIQAEVTAISAAQDFETIPESLLKENDLDAVRAHHAKYYYGLIPVGDGKDQAGAVLNARYYERNAKMMAKIDLIARPGERILVLVGSGHLYWLHHFVTEIPGYTYVSPNPYLIAADAMLESSD